MTMSHVDLRSSASSGWVSGCMDPPIDTGELAFPRSHDLLLGGQTPAPRELARNRCVLCSGLNAAVPSSDLVRVKAWDAVLSIKVTACFFCSASARIFTFFRMGSDARLLMIETVGAGKGSAKLREALVNCISKATPLACSQRSANQNTCTNFLLPKRKFATSPSSPAPVSTRSHSACACWTVR